MKTFLQKFTNDWTMNLAGMVTYALITAIVPILLAILTVASIFLGALSPSTFHQVVVSMQHSLGNAGGAINVGTIANNVTKITGPLAIVSIIGLILGGGNLSLPLQFLGGIEA